MGDFSLKLKKSDLPSGTRLLPIDLARYRDDQHDKGFEWLYSIRPRQSLREFGSQASNLEANISMRNTLLNAVPHEPQFLSMASTSIALDQACLRLKECENNHSTCRPHDHCLLPSRLIVVGNTDADLRLFQSSDQQRGKYACLSHCWGGDASILLTQDTQQRFLRRIPWNDLPTTYRDAVVWCRLLRIPFLWIDALRIVQDDPVDWAKESVRMAKICGCCYVTLAAASSANHEEGCRVQRPLRYSTCIEPHGGMQQFCVGPYRNESFRVRVAGEKELPLLRRAWVLQEWALSPRLLHFATHEILFECSAGGVVGQGDRTGYNLDFGLPRTTVAESNWHSLVNRYNHMALSVWNDRL